MTASEILSNAFVITSGGIRLEQFRRSLSSVGLDPAAVREWRACEIASDGSMGCAVAHYSLVRHAEAADLPWLVVFEDDAVPCDDACDALVRVFETRAPETLCLRLGWSYDSDPDAGPDAADHRRVYGSHAYALFGATAYRTYMDEWAKNGISDIVIERMAGARMNGENLFAQHTPRSGEGIHLPSGWTADAEIERMVDREMGDRFRAAREVAARMEEERSIHVAYALDVRGGGAAPFLDMMLAGVHSLRESKAHSDALVVHLLYGSVPAEFVRRMLALSRDGFRVRLHPIGEGDMEGMQRLTRGDPASPVRTWSGICFARMFLFRFLPENVRRVIYLDADTLVRGSLRPLWETDPGGRPLAMNMGVTPEYGYNSGVILMDLAAMRAEPDLERRLVAFLDAEARSFFLPDQTALNRFFAGRIADIGRGWNFPPVPGASDPALRDAAIWHFYAGAKPSRLSADDAGRSLVDWNKALILAERAVSCKEE